MSFPRIPKKAEKFFLSKSWEDHFDSARLNRGKMLFSNEDARIDNILVDVDSASFAFFTVTGSYAYEVEVNFTTNQRLYTFCDCPDDEKCKHIAAALYTLERHIVESRPKIEHAELVKPVLSVDSWLDSLFQSTDKETGQGSEDDFPPNYKDRIIYFLGAEYDYDPVALHAYKGRLQKDGTYKITAHRVRTDYQEYNKPKFITNVDLRLLNQISFASGNAYGASSVRITSPKFADILLECLDTGRVIVKKADSVHDRNATYLPLELGEDRTLTPNWSSISNNALKPTLLIDPKPDEIIYSEPKVYIDRSQNTVGKIIQTHSDPFLKQWLLGPNIPQSDLEKVHQLIEQKPNTTAPKKRSGKKLSTAIPQLPKQHILENCTPTPVLKIERTDASSPTHLLLNSPAANILIGTLSFRYAEHSVPAEPFSENFTTSSADKITTIHRNQKQEQKLLQQLRFAPTLKLEDVFENKLIKQDFSQSRIYSDSDALNTQQWIAFISSEVPNLEAAGWTVNIGELDYTLLDYDSFFEVMSQNELKNEWFRFDLGVELNGERFSLIPALANAISSGMYEGYDFDSAGDGLIAIPLDKKNTFINFPAKRFKLILDKVQDIFQHINAKGNIEIPPLRAATLVDDLDLDKSNQTLCDLAQLGNQLKNITGLPKTRVPKNLNAELRDYQIVGFRWLQFLARHKLHGVLADDMGLGKTIQALTHILAEKNAKRNNKLPTLVVAPTSVIPNWTIEAAKFTPSLKVLLLHGSDRHLKLSEISKHDILITSYALLQRDEAIHKKQQYHIAILDESQYIKNATAKTTKVAYKIQAKQRICLSGTPMENHLGELWSTFNFLMPGLLQSNKEFTSTFRRPIERHSDTAKQISLNRRVGPLILRRTKDVVAKELPPKTIIPHHISLTQEQTDLYESVRATMDKRVRDAISDQGLSKSQIIILDALLKLRQICCHPQLLRFKEAQKVESSAKLDYLTELLGPLIEEGRRILIFSQFTTMLAMIEEHLHKEKIAFTKITGSTRDRQTPVEQFQSGKIPVFLISLKAGGTGLNLTAADTVIHYDPWWNPAAENQATDRAYRIGQDKPVFVHKLICQGTIEEHIQELQAKKAKLVESLLSGSTNKLSLTTETLNGLLAPIEA
ncbi:MAG: DEAD/DEAH box helicase [Rubritalea sp.]|uniref:DEAD/DEAH box helicase n=1 Tax=Rubritalea sp. TaxID=2109375 RepID=UPI003242EF12